MLTRTLEPEVMDTELEARDYAQMDHSAVNQLFVQDLIAALWTTPRPADHVWEIFDAGTGTAQIPIQLLQWGLKAQVLAADAAASMLQLARSNIVSAGLTDAIHPIQRDCKALPDRSDWFDVVMSNSLLHHIPEPVDALQECWRILRPGGLLFVRDLQRPSTAADVERLVITYAAEANPHQQQLFRASLHAALTLDEVQALLTDIGVTASAVASTSDRHWTIAAIKPAQ
jgi:ubiquinone/menaquinone biosynthesis C-methylase UbiE